MMQAPEVSDPDDHRYAVIFMAERIITQSSYDIQGYNQNA